MVIQGRIRREHPAFYDKIHPPPRDPAKSAVLKSAGTATGQTRLHQKPGEAGRVVSREGAAAPAAFPEQPVQRASFVTFSAGKSLYYSWPGERSASGDRLSTGIGGLKPQNPVLEAFDGYLRPINLLSYS